MNTASIWAESLGWALFHSLWQGALIYLLLRMLLPALASVSTRVRYYCAYLSQFLLLGWFGSNIYTEWQRLQGVPVKVTEGGTDPTGARVFFVKAMPEQAGFPGQELTGWLEQAFPWIALAYAAGVLLLSLRFLAGIYQVQLLRSAGTAQPPEALSARLESLLQRMGVGRPVRLLLTGRLDVPVVFGVIKPVILLPFASAAQLTTEQLEAILLHELAHIRRNDYLLNLLQTVTETVLFFNPFTWLIGRIARREREHCCDDLVLAHTSHPLPYATALAALEASRIQPGSFALAATGTKHELLNRIKRIMETKKHSVNYGQTVVALVLIAVLITSAVFLTPSFAQNRKDRNAQTREKAEAKPKKIIIIDEDGGRTEYDDFESLPRSVRKSVQASAEAADLAGAATADALKIADDVLRDIDVAGITGEVARTLQEVRLTDIAAQVDQAMAEIDWNSINSEIEEAMADVRRELNDPRVREDVKTSLREAQQELREASAMARRDMTRAREDLREARRELSAARRAEAAAEAEEAHAGRAAASASSASFRTMLDRMEEEKLIDRKKGFAISKSKGRLYINGKLQDGRVFDAYEQDLGEGDVSITGKEDNLTISIRN